MEDLQQCSSLENVEGPAGAGVEAVHAASTGEVCHHLIEEVGPSQGLYCVVCHQVYFADHPDVDVSMMTNVSKCQVSTGTERENSYWLLCKG